MKTFFLTAKRDFDALKAKVDKLEINKLVKIPTDLNNLKTKVDDLDVGKLKTVPVDLKKLIHVVSKEVVKKTVYNKVNTTVSNLEKKIPDGTTLFQINQNNADKQNFLKNLGMLRIKYLTLVFLIQKLQKLRTKYRILAV